jgi:tetratricopeptide (TPR) repeat protein
MRTNDGPPPNLIQDSITDLNKAIELNSNYAWAYAYRAVFYRLNSSSDKAYENLEEAARLNPDVFYNYIEPELVENKLDSSRKKGFVFFSAEQVNQAQQQLVTTPEDPFALYITTLSKLSEGGFAAIKEELNQGRKMRIF